MARYEHLPIYAKAYELALRVVPGLRVSEGGLNLSLTGSVHDCK